MAEPAQKPQDNGDHEPPPQGRLASTVRESRWFFRFLERIAESKNAAAFVAILLTSFLIANLVWNAVERYLDKRDEFAVQLEEKAMEHRFSASENERNRQHEARLEEKRQEGRKLEIDSWRYTVDSMTKANRDVAKALGIHSARIDSFERAFRATFPGKILFEILSAYFGASRPHVAPMPRLVIRPAIVAAEDCPGPEHIRTP